MNIKGLSENVNAKETQVCTAPEKLSFLLSDEIER